MGSRIRPSAGLWGVGGSLPASPGSASLYGASDGSYGLSPVLRFPAVSGLGPTIRYVPGRSCLSHLLGRLGCGFSGRVVTCGSAVVTDPLLVLFPASAASPDALTCGFPSGDICKGIQNMPSDLRV